MRLHRIGYLVFAMTATLDPASASGAGCVVKDLRCEYLRDPEGIGAARPRLSWVIRSDRRGARQTAYQVLVAGGEAELRADEGRLWDSGKAASARSVHVEYGGAALKSRTRCYWKVRIWDEAGQPSDWSPTGRWSMGLLRPRDWKAKWIGLDGAAASKAGSKTYRASPYLRKEFRVKGDVRRATVYATALGIYELHLNGRRVGDAYFTPGWTEYAKRLYHNTYDVTDLIRKGPNAIGGILADGWYAGNISSLGQRRYGRDLRLKVQLHLEYEDASEEVVVSDESWRASCGPIREADFQAGEVYDARLEMPGWCEAGFDQKGWEAVDVGPPGRPARQGAYKRSGATEAPEETADAARRVRDAPVRVIPPVIQPYPGAAVRRTGEVRTVSVAEPKPGRFVFDLGQNFAGVARLKTRAPRGTKIVLRFAEMLQPDGTIYTANLRSARCTDTYICKGGGQEVWTPRFTFHGLRYVEVTGLPARPTREAITGVVLHSDAPLTSGWECSDGMLNRLYRNIVWTQRSNYLEVPMDCPQRDERLGWMGDAQFFMRAGTYNQQVGAFFTKWLRDVADAQKEGGAFTDVAPCPHNFVGSAGWADAGVICPWTLYTVYGDRRILRTHYDSMARWIDWRRRQSGDCIVRRKTFGDWLNVGAATSTELIGTAYFARTTGMMAEIAEAIGRKDDAAGYRKLHAKIKRAFNKAFVSADGKVAGDTQTAYLLALQFDLLPRGKRPAAARHLVECIRRRNWHLSTGTLGTGLLLPTLSDVGRTDVAYRLIRNTTYPSWGCAVRNGATTIWERWDSYTKQKGFGDARMNSFNQYALGSVGEWMFRYMAGIDAGAAGYETVRIRPRPGGGITYCKAHYDSIRGRIASHWAVDGGRLVMDVTIPANTKATVRVPTAAADSVRESGKPAGQSEGVRLLRKEKKAAVFEVGSGRYRFSSAVGSEGP